jgi:hypothetical protein
MTWSLVSADSLGCSPRGDPIFVVHQHSTGAQHDAGSLPSMLIAGLGVMPDALEGTLRIRRPSLPRHVNQVALEGLRVGHARVDLLFERIAPRPESVALTDVKIVGQLDVVREISRSPNQVVRVGRRQSGSRSATT